MQPPIQVPVTIATYNVRRCLGTDRRLSPDRIAQVIARCDADIVALQEIDVGRLRSGGIDQACVIAEKLGFTSHFHPALRIADEQYGDAVLTRCPSRLVKVGLLPGLRNLWSSEPRGAVWIEALVGGVRVQVINTHFGLRRRERRLDRTLPASLRGRRRLEFLAARLGLSQLRGTAARRSSRGSARQSCTHLSVAAADAAHRPHLRFR